MRQRYPETIQVSLTFHKWSKFVKENDLEHFNGKLCVIYPEGSDFPLHCIYHRNEMIFTIVSRCLGSVFDIPVHKVLYVSFDPLFEKMSFDDYFNK